jgi:hypothetical protein
MLFEMATGNLSFRIIKTDQNDELDKLSEMLNNLARLMHDIILQSGYVNPHYSYQNLVQTTFILDDNFTIRNFNAHVPEALYYKSQELFQVDFGKFIAPQSFSIWNQKKKEATLVHFEIATTNCDFKNDTFQTSYSTALILNTEFEKQTVKISTEKLLDDQLHLKFLFIGFLKQNRKKQIFLHRKFNTAKVIAVITPNIEKRKLGKPDGNH